ncbi:hypothetical protein TFLX_03177 [Thermoflexales bacterium]|nr:hypothetical protein TFLX_03177 [Thermoflexales bacterium]
MRRFVVALPWMSLWMLLAACQADVAVPSRVAPIPTSLPPAPAAGLIPADLTPALRQMQLDKYIGIQPIRQETIAPSGWTIYHYDKADCQCILGDDYALLARPGKESNKTVFWLEGGGACWPGQENCTKSLSLRPDMADYGLASQDVRNPLRDWNFVYVPYCDGSIHMGDHDADYDGDGQVDHHHQGLRTTSAAVALMKDLFPQSEKILIAGCSAGGYGTLMAAPITRLQFPEAQLYVVNEGGPGLYNPARQDDFQLILDTWNLDPYLPADCPQCREQLIQLYPWLLARDPQLKVGMFSSYQDSVIGQAYLGMTPTAFRRLLVETTDKIHAEFSDTFKRYFIKGTAHCVPDYFYSVDGVSVRDWIEDLMNDSPEWQDVLE